MTRRFRPDALLLVVILAGGYLAYSAAPRPASEGSPASTTPVAEVPTAASPVLPVRTGAPTVSHSPAGLVTGVRRASDPVAVGAPPANRLLTAAELAPAPSTQPSAGSGAHATALLAPGNGTVAPRRAVKRPLARPAATARPRAALAGSASFYCLPPRWPRCTVGYPPDCACAAAGSELRRLLGDWRGRTVTVTYGSAEVSVRLIDCLCSPGLIDLYGQMFAGLAPLSLGRIPVTVTW